MILTKRIWAEYQDGIEPLVFANIFVSDAQGKIIPGGYLGQTDANGYFDFETATIGSYVTVSWMEQKTTFTITEFKNGSEFFVPISENELDEVIITPDYDDEPDSPEPSLLPNISVLYLLVGFAVLKSFT